MNEDESTREQDGLALESVEQVAEVRCAYCATELAHHVVYVCREPQRPLRELWPALKRYI
jgi:hypothetical protein